MNGADALLSTLVANEVTACFANPGTSEMQFVAALDRSPKMRPVLCLFEGVATGPPMATAASPTSRPARCCTWVRAMATGWPTCTTPAAPIRLSSM